jgi:hypothetical protein
MALSVLNYTVTSNHIHLLVADDKSRNVIPDSIKLIAGRTGQEFNQRKARKGAYCVGNRGHPRIYGLKNPIFDTWMTYLEKPV